MTMTGPQRMAPPPADDDDEPEVTRASLDRDRRRQRERERAEAKREMTRRSWYTTEAAVDAFAAAVDDIHHATRVPKTEVIAALMEAAVRQAPKVQARLAKQHPRK